MFYRLPIIQGASYTYLSAAFAVVSEFGDCPSLLPKGTAYLLDLYL